jgi:site-specific recombinase XerD
MSVSTLTNELIKELICPANKTHIEVFDTEVKGFYLDVLSSGKKMFRIRFRVNGRKRLLSLGDANQMTLDVARQKAINALSQVKVLALVDRNHETPHSIGTHKQITIGEFLNHQYLPYVRSYKRSYKSDVSMIQVHLEPLVGHLVMARTSVQDISGFIELMKQKQLAPGTINRALVLLRYAFKLANRWSVPGVSLDAWNGISYLKNDNRIERYLTAEESSHLLKAMRASKNEQLPMIVAFLIYTGARKREVLDAKWADINWVHKSWKISINKSNKIRHIPLSDGAVETLMAVKAKSDLASQNDYIFANPHTGKPFRSFFYSWDAARQRAGMPELRVHDLRHSFASFLVNAGRSLYEVQELLGHADVKTTSRYAHLSRERLSAAVACVPRL